MSEPKQLSIRQARLQDRREKGLPTGAVVLLPYKQALSLEGMLPGIGFKSEQIMHWVDPHKFHIFVLSKAWKGEDSTGYTLGDTFHVGISIKPHELEEDSVLANLVSAQLTTRSSKGVTMSDIAWEFVSSTPTLINQVTSFSVTANVLLDIGDISFLLQDLMRDTRLTVLSRAGSQSSLVFPLALDENATPEQITERVTSFLSIMSQLSEVETLNSDIVPKYGSLILAYCEVRRKLDGLSADTVSELTRLGDDNPPTSPEGIFKGFFSAVSEDAVALFNQAMEIEAISGFLDSVAVKPEEKQS